MSNAQTLQGNWNSIKGKIREKWGQITEDDLQHMEGKSDQLVGLIQRKTGQARDAVEEVLDGFVEKGASFVSNAAESAQKFAGQAAEVISNSAGQVADTVRKRADQAQHFVRDQPAASLAVTFGAGVITGLVIGLILRDR